MIQGILVLVLVVTGWLAALWLLIAPDFSHWQIPQLAALHVGPPVVTWSVWMFWRRHRQSRADCAAAERETAANEERQAQVEEARRKHAVEVAHSQYGCDCRALAMMQVTAAADDTEPLAPEGETIFVSTVDAESESADDNTLLDHLRPGIEDALEAIYSGCPAAAAFPLYISPPTESVGAEVVACLRQIRQRFLDTLDQPVRSGSEFERVLFLPTRDSVVNSVIGLFETNPELPGAVILAFDSPAWRGRLQVEHDGDDVDAGKARHRQLKGQPSQGVFALFLTHPQLQEILHAAPGHSGRYDALTPYWEKKPAAAGGGGLAHLSEDERDTLQSAPVLARIHRAAGAQFGPKPPRSMEFARAIEALVAQAQIHAAQIELPFESPGESAKAIGVSDSTKGEGSAPKCTWLVHNAGGVDCSGARLAALGTALLGRGMDVDPIAEATNVTVRAGDLGQARGVAMLALTVARAAGGEGAALCVEFAGNDSMTLSFAVAPQGAA